MANLAKNASPPVDSTSTWARFSDAHRQTIFYAQQEAQKVGLNEVGPEHLLIGLLRFTPANSNAARLLEETGVDLKRLAEEVPSAAVQQWPPPPPLAANEKEMKLSPKGKETIDLTIKAASEMGHERIGTEHLLLGLLSQPDTQACAALASAGATLTACKERLGAWLISGQYKRETSKQAQTTPGANIAAVSRPGAVYQVRRYSQFVFSASVILISFGSLFLPSYFATGLRMLYAILMYPILIFILPYLLSTYALGYLLRSRAARGLVHMPPRQSGSRLVFPFTLSCITGLLLLITAVPLIMEVTGIVGYTRYLPVAMLILFLIILVSSWLVIITHWLLTFNIRGPALQIG